VAGPGELLAWGPSRAIRAGGPPGWRGGLLATELWWFDARGVGRNHDAIGSQEPEQFPLLLSSGIGPATIVQQRHQERPLRPAQVADNAGDLTEGPGLRPDYTG
jgi:hypothetical protein